MDVTYNLLDELTLLDASAVRLFHDAYMDLYLQLAGDEPIGPLVARRALPVSAPDDFVSLLNQDGLEVGIVRNVAALDRESCAALRSELDRTYFPCRITRVHAITVRYHVPTWDVETDRGRRVFEISSSRRDLHVMIGGRILINDADGNRYEIVDYRRLERNSRILVEGQI